MNILEDLFSLKDKVVIVTGASKGIGKELAIALAKAGANVALIARNEEDLNALTKELKKIGSDAYAVSMDLTKVEGIPSGIKKIHDYYGKIDILVNNAGTNIAVPAIEVSESDWDRVLDINLKSAFFISKSVAEYMIPRNKGKIINMSSQMALVGYYKRAAYSSSKGGLMQMTKALAIEWASHNINVNSVAPTFIETPMTKPMFEQEDFLEEVLSRIPMKRLGKAEDLFGAVIYLSSEASNLVTGHTLVVDGGWTTW